MRMARIGVISFAASLGPTSAYAQVVVSQPPTRSTGGASDTAFVDFLGRPSAQLLADDFTLPQPTLIRTIRWWGFYNEDNPPTGETMRLRFLEARLGDGLPGNVLRDEAFSDVARVPTGRTILESGFPREFEYLAHLTQPLSLSAGIVYWIEIAQIGDPSTLFRWETGLNGNQTSAALVPLTSDWIRIPGTDQAFELIVPEPLSAALFTISACGLRIAVRRKRIGA